jgi:hypothetical protein
MQRSWHHSCLPIFWVGSHRYKARAERASILQIYQTGTEVPVLLFGGTPPREGGCGDDVVFADWIGPEEYVFGARVEISVVCLVTRKLRSTKTPFRQIEFGVPYGEGSAS